MTGEIFLKKKMDTNVVVFSISNKKNQEVDISEKITLHEKKKKIAKHQNVKRFVFVSFFPKFC